MRAMLQYLYDDDIEREDLEKLAPDLLPLARKFGVERLAAVRTETYLNGNEGDMIKILTRKS